MKAKQRTIFLVALLPIVIFVGFGLEVYHLDKKNFRQSEIIISLQNDIQLLIEERNEAILLIENYPDLETWERLIGRLEPYDDMSFSYTSWGIVWGNPHNGTSGIHGVTINK